MANQGVAPVDFTSPVGQTRALMGDTDPANVEGSSGEYVWFGDDELGAFLAMNNGDPRRAAVAALRIVAITPALKLKKWTSADLQVDGAAITKALTDLIASIEAGIAATDEAYGFFGIVTPPAPTPWWELNAPNAQPGPPFLVPGFPYESLMP
jgi:hypothetical protein